MQTAVSMITRDLGNRKGLCDGLRKRAYADQSPSRATPPTDRTSGIFLLPHTLATSLLAANFPALLAIAATCGQVLRRSDLEIRKQFPTVNRPDPIIPSLYSHHTFPRCTWFTWCNVPLLYPRLVPLCLVLHFYTLLNLLAPPSKGNHCLRAWYDLRSDPRSRRSSASRCTSFSSDLSDVSDPCAGMTPR